MSTYGRLIRDPSDFLKAIAPRDPGITTAEHARSVAEHRGITAKLANTVEGNLELVNRKPAAGISADEHGRRSAEISGVPTPKAVEAFHEAITPSTVPEQLDAVHTGFAELVPLSAPPVVWVEGNPF